MSEQFNFFEEKPFEQITVTELQNMIKVYSEKRKEYDAIKDQLKDKGAEVDELETKILATLEAHNQEKFSVTGVGTVYTTNKYSVSFPKDPEKANELREYCLRNDLGTMLTINHNSLNSLFKSKKEERELRGERDLATVLPGVGEPQVYRTIGLRKE